MESRPISTPRRNGARRLHAWSLGVRSSIDTNTPIIYQDRTLRSGANVAVAVPEDHQVLLYVFDGVIAVGEGGEQVNDGQMAILGAGDSVVFTSLAGGRLLLLAGAAIGETVARSGPFVMNTDAELQIAWADYRSGKMGEIARSARRA